MTTPAQRKWQTKTPPTHHLTRLRQVLEGYRGLAHTIRAKDLGVILGINDPTGRTIREYINALIDAGVPIGSVNFEAGGGYFLIENERELVACVRNYESRVREIQKKSERLVQAFRHGPAQPSLLST